MENSGWEKKPALQCCRVSASMSQKHLQPGRSSRSYFPSANPPTTAYHRTKHRVTTPSPNGGPMSVTPSFYPPSPDLVPEELTRVSGAFRLRAMFLVGFVIFFFLLYLRLIVLSWYLFWLGIVLPVRRPDIAGGV